MKTKNKFNISDEYILNNPRKWICRALMYHFIIIFLFPLMTVLLVLFPVVWFLFTKVHILSIYYWGFAAVIYFISVTLLLMALNSQKMGFQQFQYDKDLEYLTLKKREHVKSKKKKPGDIEEGEGGEKWWSEIGSKEKKLNTYEKLLSETDDLVDEIINEFDELSFDLFSKKHTNKFDMMTFLREHREDSENVATLLDQIEFVPDWVDVDAITKALTFLRANSLYYMLGLAVALVESYTFPEDAGILFLSGGLTTSNEKSSKRLIYTIRFVWSIIYQIMGPYPKTSGNEYIINIRFIHAFVRKLWHKKKGNEDLDSNEQEDDDKKTKFAPINQATQIATLFLFCHTPLEVMNLRGIIVEDEDKENVWELWKLVGYYLGIKEQYLPSSYLDGLRLKSSEFYKLRQIPNETSKLLTKNTIYAYSHLKKFPMDKHLQEVILYRYFGSNLASQLGIEKPSAFYSFLITFFNHLHSYITVLNSLSPFLSKRMDKYVGYYIGLALEAE
eukprot:TRINITY_DN15770_c0_g1_i1.p1 TRINITY_DN15770_c0_g1~~TRINITY_DN15770_c0_g1_i1.p1  ORF type:complete len:502 (-),score=121.32 TRINITY_DN15770_c0_g1_i1:154-1659(-)